MNLRSLRHSVSAIAVLITSACGCASEDEPAVQPVVGRTASKLVLSSGWDEGSGWPEETLVALNSISLADAAMVVGDVAVITTSAGPYLSNAEEAVLGDGADIRGDLRADSVRFGEGTLVRGDAAYNDVAGHGVVLGSTTATLSTPLSVEVPTISNFSSGGSNIALSSLDDVTQSATTALAVSLAAGTVNEFTRLTLTGGTYDVASVDLADASRIECSAACTIRIKGRLTMGERAYIGPSVDAGLAASDVQVVVEGTNGGTGAPSATPYAAVIGEDSEVFGYVFAPNGTLHLVEGAQVTGKAVAHDVLLATRSAVHADQGATALNDAWVTGVAWPDEMLLAHRHAEVYGEQPVVGDMTVMRGGTGFTDGLGAIGYYTEFRGDSRSNSLFLDDGVEHYGTATYNQIDSYGSLEGDEVTPFDFPIVVPVPAFPAFVGGSTDVALDASESELLESGAYDSIELEAGASGAKTRLTLEGGIYEVNDLVVNDYAGVECAAPCELRVKNRLYMGEHSDLGPSISGPETHQVRVFVEGTDDGTNWWESLMAVHVAHADQLRALIFAPNGTAFVDALLFDGRIIGERTIAMFGTQSLGLPALDVQPKSVTLAEGEDATFVVAAIGPKLTYQWQRNGADISGATARWYTLPDIDEDDSGAVFRVVVSNPEGSTVSSNAILTVDGSSSDPAAWSVGSGWPDETLVALNSVHIVANSTVVGDVAVVTASPGPFLANGEEVVLGSAVQVRGDVRANAIRFSGAPRVYNDVACNSLVGAGIVQGATTTTLSLPLAIQAPPMDNFGPGSTDLTVTSESTVTLDQSSKAAVVLEDATSEWGEGQTRLTLTGGTYDLASLTLGENSRVECTSPCVLNIKGNLAMAAHTYLGPTAESALGAGDVQVFVEAGNGGAGTPLATPFAAEVGAESTLHAFAFVPNGTLHLNDKSQAVGKILARDVLIEPRAAIRPDGTTKLLPNWLSGTEWPPEFLVARSFIEIGPASPVYGDVIAMGAFSGDRGGIALDDSSILYGDTTSHRLTLNPDSEIHGDAAYNDLQDYGGTVYGTSTTPTTIPTEVPVPAFPAFEAGTTGVEVGASDVEELVAGAYGLIELLEGSATARTRLTLTGGIYEVADIALHNYATLECSAPCEIRVKNRVWIGENARLGPSDAGPNTPDVQVFVEGADAYEDWWQFPQAFLVEGLARVRANVFVPNGTIWLGNDYSEGRFIGDVVIAFVQALSVGLPIVEVQPHDVEVEEDGDATFVVAASGTGLSFQWQRDGVNIAGATGPSYTLAGVTSSDSGAHFRIVVTNSAGSVTSANALLTVTGSEPPSSDWSFGTSWPDASIVALNSVHFMARSHVIGDVAVIESSAGEVLSGDEEVAIGEDARIDGDVAADGIEFEEGAQVFGDAAYNALSGHGVIRGTRDAALALPLEIEVPTIANFASGSSNYVVAAHASQTLASTSKAEVVLSAGVSEYSRVTTRVVLTGGVYNFNSVSLGENSRLECAAACTINIKNRLIIDEQAYLGPSFASGLTASNVQVFVEALNGGAAAPGSTPFAAVVGADSELRAHVFAPNGTFHLGGGASVVGRVVAHDVLLDEGSSVQPGAGIAPMSDVWFTGVDWPEEYLVVNEFLHVFSSSPTIGDLTAKGGDDTPGFITVYDYTEVDGYVRSNALYMGTDSLVTGTASYNDLIVDDGTFGGDVLTPFDVPVVVAVPPFPLFTAGTTDVDIDASDDGVLAAGDYDVIHLADGTSGDPTVLTLTGGIYEVNDLVLGQNARLECSAACEMRIKNRIAADEEAYIGPSVSGPAPHEVRVFVEGTNDGPYTDSQPAAVHFQAGVDARGYFFVPNGAIHMVWGSNVEGRFIALGMHFMAESSSIGAPDIEGEPLDVTVAAGGDATFAVAAIGSQLSYQWQRDELDISGATGPSYTFEDAAAMDDGALFRVIVTNPAGEATSVEALLTVTSSSETAPSITTHPSAQTIDQGDPATFTCAASGAGVSYKWQLGGVDISGATSSSYTIAVVASTHAGSYRCVASNSAGSVTSNAATLTVNLDAPVITTHPSSATVDEGDEATFSCAASGQVLSYQWQHDGANISGATAATYSISAVTVASAGAYRCVVTNTSAGTNLAGGGSATSNAATLTVNLDAPVITSHPSSATVDEGDEATFSCAASGQVLSYQWQHDGANISGATAATYSISAVTVASAGAYRCVVTNTSAGTNLSGGGSATSNAATLTVNLDAPAITTHPSSATVDEGDEATFSCAASGQVLSYQWQHDGANIAGATAATYSISAVTVASAGAYRCVVTNTSAGTNLAGGGSATSNAATLTVDLDAPVITSHPSSATVDEGDEATFSCVASGQVLSYQWQHDGTNISGATAATYTIAVVSASSAGSYRCVAANTSAGTNFAGGGSATSNAATLTVDLDAPVITTHPSNTTVDEGEEATLSCVASGEAVHYQWQLDGEDIEDAITASYVIDAVTADDAGEYGCVVVNTNAGANLTGGGSVNSTLATLTIDLDAPVITTHPADQTVSEGEDATFTCAASGSRLTYQWQRGTTDIAGAVAATLTVEDVDNDDEGTYRCIVSNDDAGEHLTGGGSVASNGATLTVGLEPPVITTPPLSATIAEGSTFSLSVVASGGGLSYRWQRAGVDVSGATSATYAKQAVLSDDGAQYRVIVTNESGSVTSSVATISIADDVEPTLTVNNPAQVTIDGDHVTITGNVHDNASGAIDATVTNSQFPGEEVGVVIHPDGTFEGDLPVTLGTNTITITVADASGNETQHTITVIVEAPAVPRIFITAPINDSFVQMASTTVSGVIWSSLPADDIRLELGGLVAFPTGTNQEYEFQFANVPLLPGPNQLSLVARTPAGTSSASVLVHRGAAPPPSPAIHTPPVIELVATGSEVTLSTDDIPIRGVVRSDSCVSSVTVEGVAATLTGAGATVTFERALSFTTLGVETAVVDIVATDCNGLTASRSLTVHHDDGAPDLTIASLSLAPTVNSVLDSPYRVTGTVSDSTLSGLTAGGQSIGATPTENDGEWTFAFDVVLVRGVETPIVIEAWDRAGNLTTRNVILQLDSSFDLEVLAPQPSTSMFLSEPYTSVEVVARAVGMDVGDVVTVAVDGGAPQTLTRAGDYATGSVTLDPEAGTHRIVVRVVNGGSTLAERSVELELIDPETVPLTVTRQEPEPTSTNIEANAPITLHFSRPYDPSKFEISVVETAHGRIFEKPEDGTDFTTHSAPKLIRIDRDQSPVAGDAQNFPGNRMLSFYPSEDYAYGGTVELHVVYDGEPLWDSRFSIRPLPTLSFGFVANQDAVPLQGITVFFPALGRTVVTNDDGTWDIGFGDPAEARVAPGRYLMQVNPDGRDPRYASLSRFINIDEGCSFAGTTMVLEHDPSIAAVEIQSQQVGPAVLADGDLELDLSAADILTRDGLSVANVRAEFLSSRQIGQPTPAFIHSDWVFSLAPSGIEVEGDVGIRINMPTIRDSYEYLNEIPRRVVLLGLDPRTLTLVPVGVGSIDPETKKLTSEGPVHLERLDYIGICSTVGDGILFGRYISGELTLQQLVAAIEEAQ